MDINVGIKIKELRKSLGLTQKELAKKIGIAQQTLCGYERLSSQPDIETLKKIAIFFSVSTDYLLGLEDNLPNSDNYYNELLSMGSKLNPINRKILIGNIAQMIKEQDIDANSSKKDIG